MSLSSPSSPYDISTAARRRRIRQAQARLERHNEAEQKFIRIIGNTESPEAAAVIDHTTIGRKIGRRREAVSNIVRRLERQGIILVERPRKEDGRFGNQRIRLNERWELDPHRVRFDMADFEALLLASPLQESGSEPSPCAISSGKSHGSTQSSVPVSAPVETSAATEDQSPDAAGLHYQYWPHGDDLAVVVGETDEVLA